MSSKADESGSDSSLMVVLVLAVLLVMLSGFVANDRCWIQKPSWPQLRGTHGSPTPIADEDAQ